MEAPTVGTCACSPRARWTVRRPAPGVSGRLAIHHARGEIGENEVIEIESIIGTRFTGRVAGTTTFGPHPAVIPEVGGSAHITGRHEFFIDPDDPLREGFLLR
jgi:proline racemase